MRVVVACMYVPVTVPVAAVQPVVCPADVLRQVPRAEMVSALAFVENVAPVVILFTPTAAVVGEVTTGTDCVVNDPCPEYDVVATPVASVEDA